MTRQAFGTYSLMVTVVLWGVLLGGVVYSHIVFFPVYLSDLPASSAVVNGPYALNEARFWLTIHPLLLLSLIVSIVANWRNRERRRLITATFAVYFVILVITSLYFVPELLSFAGSTDSSAPVSEWHARADRWQYLSWLRGATLFVFSIPLLLALVRREKKDEDS